MKRALLITVLLAAAAIAVLGTGASGGKGGDYKVRAIFDNAVSVIPGEDVKVAGVKVGKISHLDVTRQQKAAVTLAITDAGFQDFRQDATCTIRPQSLIGEKFVECVPTQPRAQGDPEVPELNKIEDGQGKGEYLLPLKQTSSPVDIDLIGNILRLPYRERLTIILNELGTGLAGRGADLRETLQRANPALRETDKVLKILGDQNKILANLVTDSDTVIAPLARDKRRVSGFIEQSATVAQATAERRAALEDNFRKLPEFLRQLRPTMVRLSAFADQATPVLADLGTAAPSLYRFTKELGPFSEASIPAFQALGKSTDAGRPALQAFSPRIDDLRHFSNYAKPVASNLAKLTTSLKNTGGIERLLDYGFFQVAAINGFDQYGHYLRAGLMVNLCSTYAISRDPTCSANFDNAAGSNGAAATAQLASPAGRDPELVAQDRVVRGLPVGATGATGPTGATGATGAGSGGPLRLPSIVLPGATPDPSGRGAGSTPKPSSGPAPRAPASQALLDYLMGGG